MPGPQSVMVYATGRSVFSPLHCSFANDCSYVSSECWLNKQNANVLRPVRLVEHLELSIR